MNDDANKVYTSGGVNNAFGMFGEQMGQQVASGTSMEAIGGTAGGAALGALGIFTIPAGAFGGWKMGSSVNMGLMEAGSALAEMDELGIPRETSEPIALVVGGVNTGIEYLQLSALGSIYGAATNAGKTQLSNAIGQLVLTMTKEGAQEAVQEAVTMTGVAAAAKLSDKEAPYTRASVEQRGKDAFIGGALMGTVFEGVGRVGGITYKLLNQLSDADIYALDDEITKNYSEQLASGEGRDNYIEQSKKGQTSVEAAKDHIIAVQEEMGKVNDPSSINHNSTVEDNVVIPTEVNKKLIVQRNESVNTDVDVVQQTTQDLLNTQPLSSKITVSNVILPNVNTDQNVVSNENINQESLVKPDTIMERSTNSNSILMDNDIQNMIDDKKVFSDDQLDSMNNRQLYHVLRTKSFDHESQVPNIYDKVVALKGDIDGMKSLVKELQGDEANNSRLQRIFDGGTIKLSEDKLIEGNPSLIENFENIEKAKAEILNIANETLAILKNNSKTVHEAMWDHVNKLRTAKNLPKSFDVDSGNMGSAWVKIDGQMDEVISAFSRYDNETGFASLKDTRQFETLKVNNKQIVDGVGAFDRSVDTESKILEEIYLRLIQNKGTKRRIDLNGSINLYTERAVCASCDYVIQQFQQLFPNIVINIIKGKP